MGQKGTKYSKHVSNLATLQAQVYVYANISAAFKIEAVHWVLPMDRWLCL